MRSCRVDAAPGLGDWREERPLREHLLIVPTARSSRASVVHFLELLGGLPIVVEQETPERMFKEIVSLAREHRLSTYDASYLDLAMRLDLPLSTQDASLVKAARKCKVPIYEPVRAR